MRPLLIILVAATLGCSTPISGHKVTDTKLNREVVAVMTAYQGAMEARDADRVLGLVAKQYFEDLGNTDTADDYGRDGLSQKLKNRFAKTTALVMKLELIDVVPQGDTLAARMRFEVRYRLNLPSGSRWERHTDVNEVILVREGSTLKIKSGL
jgi:hypothetical protein